jgi:hypothetical protein
MAIPTCPHCSATQFEFSEDEPLAANYKIFIFHCGGCGAPFGAMEYVVAGALLADQEKRLMQMQESIAALDRRAQNIERFLRPR